jgi:hypothetical protein
MGGILVTREDSCGSLSSITGTDRVPGAFQGVRVDTKLPIKLFNGRNRIFGIWGPCYIFATRPILSEPEATGSKTSNELSFFTGQNT